MANDFQDRNNVAQAARVTGERTVVTTQDYWKWVMEGKVFEGGFGAEDTAADSQAAMDDTLATFALQAPVADTPIVVPIILKLMCIADGGALSNFQVLFTKPAALVATAMALTGGRALTSKHALYRKNPPIAESKASALYGAATTFAITVTAMVAADYVSYHLGHAIDAVLTTGLVAMGEGPSNVHTFRFLEDGVPHLLTQGAAMLVYVYTASTDSTWFPYMQWAELEPGDLY